MKDRNVYKSQRYREGRRTKKTKNKRLCDWLPHEKQHLRARQSFNCFPLTRVALTLRSLCLEQHVIVSGVGDLNPTRARAAKSGSSMGDQTDDEMGRCRISVLIMEAR